ncbi:MAG TPA: EAL domain-containing protein, partial [Tissierellaceae bacterium]|nr:EAL domain-containing protein [Tissierellaceae bacterium]
NYRKIVAVEALLRWTHPKYKNISPLFMIRIAEESGIINDIGEWVLKEACKQNKSWQDKGLAHIKVSVNVSAMQFEQEDFVATVEEVLFETGMDPKYLELEITETNIMDNVVEKMDKMKELKDLGISISIDDFGTGYSSLAYFTRFPIDTLKIDKSFISGMLKDENSETIVKTIINMGKSINLKLVAEGVETEEQLERLEEMGCDKIQGYLISKPLESKKIVELFN